jgi:hypothetical protein
VDTIAPEIDEKQRRNHRTTTTTVAAVAMTTSNSLDDIDLNALRVSVYTNWIGILVLYRIRLEYLN